MYSLDNIIELDEKYYMNVFGKRTPVMFEKGEGVYLFDQNNKRYLDFIAGIAVCSLGHGHLKFKEALHDQIDNLIHTSSLFYVRYQTLLAKKLCSLSGFDKVFFCNSGAEANEAAIKLVRKYFKMKGEKKYKILTFNNSFHGRTLATITATGKDKYKKPFEPLPEGFLCVEPSIEKILSAIDEYTAALMIEFVQGEGGVVVFDNQFIKDVYTLCKQKDILFIADEVQTGIGRCGSMFCFEQYDVVPDIITLAKGLGGGIPIGALLAKNEFSAFEPGDHGSTFGGNPLATRAAYEVLNIIEEENIINNVKVMGEYLYNKLNVLKEKYKSIVDVRGLGLLIGVEFNFVIKELIHELCQNGLLVSSSGNGNVVRFAPPLIVNKEHIDEAVNIFENVVMKYDLGGINK